MIKGQVTPRGQSNGGKISRGFVSKAEDSGFYFKYNGRPLRGIEDELLFMLKIYFLLRCRERVIMGQDWRRNTH